MAASAHSRFHQGVNLLAFVEGLDSSNLCMQERLNLIDPYIISKKDEIALDVRKLVLRFYLFNPPHPSILQDDEAGNHDNENDHSTESDGHNGDIEMAPVENLSESPSSSPSEKEKAPNSEETKDFISSTSSSDFPTTSKEAVSILEGEGRDAISSTSSSVFPTTSKEAVSIRDGEGRADDSGVTPSTHEPTQAETNRQTVEKRGK